MPIKRFFALLFFFYMISMAGASECVVVIFGGAKEWITLLPGIDKDISISVNNEVTEQVSRTGCRILSMANDTEEDFYKNLQRLKSPPFNKPGTTYHLAFTDHGAPPGKDIKDSYIITGVESFTKNSRFMDEIKKLIPKGSHVTFETNTCWGGSFADAVFASHMDEQFSMCGSSSTAPHVMSWNLHEFHDREDGSVVGPYGAVGLKYANETKKRTTHFPNVIAFHYNAKKGDGGNMGRQPGLMTSVAYAHFYLLRSKLKSPMETTDLFDLITTSQFKPGKQLDDFIQNISPDHKKEVEVSLSGACLPLPKNLVSNFMSRLGPLYRNLLNEQYENLPAPINSQVKNARDFLLRNQNRFATLLSTIARERALFIKKNELYPREKYTSIEEDWKALLNEQNKKLSAYFFNMRLLQEGKTVQAFLARAPQEEQLRFNRILECEKQPML